MILADYYIRHTELGVILSTGLLLIGLVGVGYGISRWLKSNAPHGELGGPQQFLVVLSVLLLAGLVVATSEPLGDDPDAEGDYVTVEEARFYPEGLYGAKVGRCEGRGSREDLAVVEGDVEPNEFPWISCVIRDIDNETATREGIFPGEVVTYNFGP